MTILVDDVVVVGSSTLVWGWFMNESPPLLTEQFPKFRPLVKIKKIKAFKMSGTRRKEFRLNKFLEEFVNGAAVKWELFLLLLLLKRGFSFNPPKWDFDFPRFSLVEFVVVVVVFANFPLQFLVRLWQFCDWGKRLSSSISWILFCLAQKPKSLDGWHLSLYHTRRRQRRKRICFSSFFIRGNQLKAIN